MSKLASEHGDIDLTAASDAFLPGTERRTVAVFRQHFLPMSQTFVRDHLLQLQRYRPVAVARSLTQGGIVVDGVPLVLCAPRGRLQRKIAFWEAKRARYPFVRRALEQVNPDVVHAHFGTGGVMVRRACRRLGVPLVVTFHGFDVTVRSDSPEGSTRLGPHYERERRAVLGDAQAVVTVSQYLAGRLVEMGAAPQKVHVIPCGVDIERFGVSPVPDIARVLFVGRLVEKKGCADLLYAVAVHDGPVSVIVIGDGPLRDPLRRLAASLRLDVTFLGAQSHDRVRAEMRRTQLVALPSRTAADGDQEGLPVVAQEAAASGRPVVGYRHSGIPEAVVDGVTGLLVDECDVAALSTAVRRLLRDHDMSQEMGTQARRHAEQRFDLRMTNALIEQVYDRVSAGAVSDSATGWRHTGVGQLVP